ncbi:Protein kinase, ATP binding site-containing protein [Artemisia annua]|uniref:non-specific serine/threonine protein kinase n=1 Tax=Artemisia annua TaxID=35608 RepID=A0A2U1MZ27_ARTAN|nr:Protein kinase, ATP binding site-containing protein [Artemisia annua]
MPIFVVYVKAQGEIKQHLYIPLRVIESATNNFADETRKDGFANEYKGQILWPGELINIAARRLNKEWDGGEQQFWNMIFMLCNLKHKNLVSLVGYCDDYGEKIIVNKYQTKGSLSNYLSDPLLTWVQRLEISVGLAHALSYIHYDESREFSLIHRDINSNSILLNDNWEPKLCDFELSMQIKSSQRHLSFNDTLCGTHGYTDPAYIETRSVSHKSDMYSFGIVLFELLCSRKSVSDYGDNKYLALVAAFHYKEKTLDDIIDLGLRKQMDSQSLNVFAETAYACLNEEPTQRPNIEEIVTRLENALKLQLECRKTEHSIAAAEVEGTSSSHDKGSVNFVSTRVVSGKKTMSSREDLSHLKLSVQDMLSTTDGLAPEDIIIKSERRIIYKGRLLHPKQFDIIGKVLLSDSVKDESKTFWTEILMLSSLKHKNLVSLIGFYDEEGEKIIIYKREANGSLSKHLSNQTLTWMQRLKICVGVAKALNYILYDAERDFSVLHCNIKSSKILLDEEWEPKLSGFEFSMKNTVARRHRLLLTRDIVNNAYLDPKYKKTGGLTHKSDVYSFGVVLFEVLCGRSAALRDEDELGEGLLSQIKKSHLDDMIDLHLRNQMDTKSLQIFSETAYWCVKEERADRPYIDQVVIRLKNALGLQWKHENPEPPRNAIDGASSSHLKWKNLEHLKIALNDIKLATENFADKHRIGSGAFGTVYKAQLEHFDSSDSSSIDGENKCDFPKKRSTVAIKHITNPQGEQGFNVEIETLTSCKHENIISLLGFCDEGPDHMILVYELASKGSLEDYLGNSDKMTNLTWMQRLKICLDIAHGLNYIHTDTDQEKQKIIHRDIKSANILLGDNWEAKIADFGLSKFHPANQDASTFIASTVAGTPLYLDPEYQKLRPGKLNKKSDIYSFGVVLFEILTGRLAHDFDKGIASIARHHFEKGTTMEIVDRMIKEETDEHVFSLSKGPNKESLDIFTKIAFQCLAMTQAERPSIDVVINELKKALYCQENHKDNLKLSLKDIKLATRNFNQDNFIGHGDSGKVYKEVAAHTLGQNNIAAKRLNRESGQGEAEFMAELDILMEYKHDNVIGLVGYCDEEEEKIIVYKFASRGSLDRYLSDVSLTWVMRLKICIDIATGLEFLHRTASSQQVFLPFLAKHRYQVGKLDELVFEGIKGQIVPQSYITFTRIALQCLHHRRERRPTAGEVIIRLKEALEFQEDHELWEPKLPKDYKEIIQMSKCPKDYSTIKKEDLSNTFTKGILLQQDKVLSFDGDGKRNELVSAKTFTYKKSCPHKWHSLKESRFEKVAEMSDISKLNIEIETNTQLLSPNIVYGVYLVFKLCDSRKFSTKPIYVNAKYRKGAKTLQAYFATQRDENWMMIELYRFLNQNEDVFKFLLESFSLYYCGDCAIYVEGIEFRAIDKVKHDDIGYLKEVQQVLKSNFNVDHVQQLPTEEIFEIHNNYDELFWLGEVNGKKLLVLSAKAFSDVDLFTSKPSAQSRFQEVIELLPQQVFYINCTFNSQMLSLDTKYVCYFVFKISEEYQGLHNPVRVRDLLREENEEGEFYVYFITPSQFNIHDFTGVPKQRDDGWMEIQLWEFNSTHELKDDSLFINMKFTSLEGMLSGLIICGLEFRPT